MNVTVLDSLTAPAGEGRTNEDAIGATSISAWVIDGATGLGDQTYVPDAASDAAWLAGFASRHFAAASDDHDIRTLVRNASEAAAMVFDAVAPPRNEVPPYALPLAAMVLLKVGADGVSIAMLGDCRAWFRDEEGRLHVLTGNPEAEERERDASRQARTVVDRDAHQGEFRTHPLVLEHLRMARANASTDASARVLGLDPSVADRMKVEVAIPRVPGTILLTSDGFHAAATDYDLCRPEDLLDRAVSDGLESLLAETRRIEFEIDPDCRLYLRFKQADDASAMLLRIDP